MLQPGNNKVGRSVWTWSLPAIVTCPGATTLCLKYCYAKTGHFCYRDVREAHARNLKRSRLVGFSDWLRDEIDRVLPTNVRLHTSGDFYDAAYVEKWHRVVRDYPRVHFYGYTRSWRDPEICAALRRLAKEPNFYLWLSCDRETGAPPKLVNTRRAWMAVGDDDAPRYSVDLVFRAIRKSQQLFDRRGNPVCLYDTKAIHTNCSSCRVCFNSNVRTCQRQGTSQCRVCERPCPSGLLQALTRSSKVTP